MGSHHSLWFCVYIPPPLQCVADSVHACRPNCVDWTNIDSFVMVITPQACQIQTIYRQRGEVTVVTVTALLRKLIMLTLTQGAIGHSDHGGQFHPLIQMETKTH